MNNLLLREVVLLRKCVLRTSSYLNQGNYFAQQEHKRNFTQGFWSSVSSSAPVTNCQEAIIQIHDLSGLPWWSTIIISTFMLRTAITFPLAIYQSKVLAKVEKVSEEMPAIVKELKVETVHAMKKYSLTEKQARFMYNKSVRFFFFL